MNDHEINEMIAEFCGIHGPWEERLTPCGCDGQWDYFNSDGRRMPHYTEDLNDINDAVLKLDDFDSDQYLVELSNECEKGIRRAWKPSECNPWCLATANALQRATALVKSIESRKQR